MQFTILVVDDDPANLRVLSAILKDDYKVMLAKSGNMAISIAQNTPPDLILLDIVMPDVSGFDVFKTLKSQNVTSQIPIMFVTGLTSISDEEFGLEMGACDYIKKPFHAGVLKARIKNQLDNLKHNSLLDKLAHSDALTDLPNRRKWQQDICQMTDNYANTKTFIAIGIIDLDSFKNYNDSYGHTLGDEALLSVANQIQTTLQSFQAQLYRFGGEEFVFVILNSDISEIDSCVEAICPAVETLNIEHCKSDTKPVLTVSGGVCIKQCKQPISSKRMLEQADELLYKVKQQGKNKILSTYSF